MKQKLTKKTLHQHLCALHKRFSLYFNDVHVSKSEWARNPFGANNVSGLTTCEQEQLVDMSCDGSSEDLFDADKLPQLWLSKFYQTSNKGVTSFCDNMFVRN